MPKVKISEYSATANSNTDVASINIDEGCAPSGINNAIRAVMGHLKDFQQGTNGDPFNGPVNGTVGATTPSTGAFTTLTTTGTINLITVGRGAGAVATNTAVGLSALAANTTGDYSTALGNGALYSQTDGRFNTALGWYNLYSNVSGTNNTASGYQSLYSTTASHNTGYGNYTLRNTTTGASNTAVGSSALQANTTASNNTAVGYQALSANTTGTAQVAVGNLALDACTTGTRNTAIGDNALGSMTTADNNTAVGRAAGLALTTGVNNTFVGGYNNSTGGSGYEITTGSKNTIIGSYNGNQGGLDIRTASNYIVLSDGDGNPRLYVDNGPTLVCPAAYSVTSANAANMVVLSNGSIARSTSALKYKQDIRDIEEVDINLLRGVRYKSKSEHDDQTKDHFGIVADEVDAAGIKELVSYGADGEVEGFQYERLTVVLLKAIQTLKAEVDSLKSQLNGASA
jgi:hypothetical protein